MRPIELLAETGCLGPRTTVVHVTHADGHELDLLGQAAARVCACLTTEANLGDGFVPVERIRERKLGVCIGSDSNVRIDPLEELRELETVQPGPAATLLAAHARLLVFLRAYAFGDDGAAEADRAPGGPG